jgi:hypothetical protein
MAFFPKRDRIEAIAALTLSCGVRVAADERCAWRRLSSCGF